MSTGAHSLKPMEILKKILGSDLTVAQKNFAPDQFNVKTIMNQLTFNLLNYYLRVGNKTVLSGSDLDAAIASVTDHVTIAAVIIDMENIASLTSVNGGKFLGKGRTTTDAEKAAKEIADRGNIKDTDLTSDSGAANLITWGRLANIFAMKTADAIRKGLTNPICTSYNTPRELGCTGFGGLLHFENSDIRERAVLVLRMHNINMSKTLDKKHEKKIAYSNVDYDQRGGGLMVTAMNNCFYEEDVRKNFTESLEVGGKKWLSVLKDMTDDDLKMVNKYISDPTSTSAKKSKKGK